MIRQRNSVTIFLATILLLVSAASMALEIIAGRALAPYVGMSLYSWTVIIAVVLSGLSVGHWLGGIIADRSNRPYFWLLLTFIAASLTSLFSLALLRLIENQISDLGPVHHILVLASGAFFLPSMFAGIISPILTKLALDGSNLEQHGRVLGLMFAAGAVGAILGTLLSGLVLISVIGTTGSTIIVAGLYAFLAIPFCMGKFRLPISVFFILVLASSVYSPSSFGISNACFRESSYFCIRVDDIVFNGRPSRVLALDHLAHGVNDAEEPTMLLSAYVQGVDEIVQARFKTHHLDAFFIGGGAYTLPRAWNKTYNAGRLIVAELDPEVTKIAQNHLWLQSSDNMEIYHGDARRILRSLPAETKFDVIFGDAFHDISIPAHLVTDEFHNLILNRLKPEGVYVINVVDSFRKPAFLLSLVQTLEQQFKAVELWLDFESVPTFDARVTWIVLASNQKTPTATFASKNGLFREWARAPIPIMKEIIGEKNLTVLTDDYAPVDRLLAPVLLNKKLAE